LEADERAWVACSCWPRRIEGGAQYEALVATPSASFAACWTSAVALRPRVSRTPQDRARRADARRLASAAALAQRQRTHCAYGARSAISRQVSEAAPNNETITQGYAERLSFHWWSSLASEYARERTASDVRQRSLTVAHAVMQPIDRLAASLCATGGSKAAAAHAHCACISTQEGS